MYSNQAKLWTIGALLWWSVGWCQTLKAQMPYLNYEMITGATANSTNQTLNGQSYNQHSVTGNLTVPLIRNASYMLGPSITFAQTSMAWQNGFMPDSALKDRGYTTLALFAMQQDESLPIQGFVIYDQRRDLGFFHYAHPLHEVTVGGMFKHSLIETLFPSAHAGRLTLGIVLRRFPGSQRIIPYFSQLITFDDKEVLIEFPDTISYTLKVAKNHERYKIVSIIDDVSMTPLTTDNQQPLWGVDCYRVSLFGSYEKQILNPIVLQIGGGIIVENIKDYDLDGHLWNAYTTAPAPYLRIGVTAWM